MSCMPDIWHLKMLYHAIIGVFTKRSRKTLKLCGGFNATRLWKTTWNVQLLCNRSAYCRISTSSWGGVSGAVHCLRSGWPSQTSVSKMFCIFQQDSHWCYFFCSLGIWFTYNSFILLIEVANLSRKKTIKKL